MCRLQDILPDDEEMIEHMLRIPNVPAAVAAATVEAGQRFTYPQLLSAVKATVPGVEVWVKIYRHLGIICPLGMHPAAERLCCDEVLDNEVSRDSGNHATSAGWIGSLCGPSICIQLAVEAHSKPVSVIITGIRYLA